MYFFMKKMHRLFMQSFLYSKSGMLNLEYVWRQFEALRFLCVSLRIGAFFNAKIILHF